MPEPAHTELEVVDRDPLVRRVDQLRRLVHGHRPRREEAVGDRAERLAQPVAVGEADAAEGRRLRTRLRLLDEFLDRLPHRRVQRRASAALRLLRPFELVFDITAEDGPNERLDMLRVLARQKPAVDLDVAQTRDDVPLLRRRDHGRREGGDE